MTEFAPFAPPPDAGPGAPGTVGDLYRIFGTDRKRDDAPAVRKTFSTAATPPTLVDFHTGARPAVGPFDPAAVAERRAIHEQILAINRRLENLKGSLSDLTVRLGAHSATVTLPPPTESA